MGFIIYLAANTKNMKKLLLSAVLAGGLLATSAMAQITTPQPSPSASFKQAVGLSELEVSYSRPGVKGRKIFGDLVPFDKMWRTGANASSKLKMNEDFTFGGVEVKAGEYAIYTIPNQTEWTVVLYNDLSCWGVCDNYDEANEAARVKVKPRLLTEKVENLTLAASNLTNNGCDLTLSWEKTAVSVSITTDVDSKVMASIEEFVNPKPNYRPYYSAATYYLETGKNLEDALTWINKAVEIQPAFWVMHKKAKIQLALKDYKGAIATAEKSRAAATEAGNDDYVTLNNKVIAQAKSAK